MILHNILRRIDAVLSAKTVAMVAGIPRNTRHIVAQNSPAGASVIEADRYMDISKQTGRKRGS